MTGQPGKRPPPILKRDLAHGNVGVVVITIESRRPIVDRKLYPCFNLYCTHWMKDDFNLNNGDSKHLCVFGYSIQVARKDYRTYAITVNFTGDLGDHPSAAGTPQCRFCCGAPTQHMIEVLTSAGVWQGVALGTDKHGATGWVEGTLQIITVVEPPFVPLVVRYGWMDFPECVLYSTGGTHHPISSTCSAKQVKVLSPRTLATTALTYLIGFGGFSEMLLHARRTTWRMYTTPEHT